MRRAYVAVVVVVAALLSAAVFAQTMPDQRRAIGPRHEPTHWVYASDACTMVANAWALMADLSEINETTPVNDSNRLNMIMGWQQATAQWLMAQTMVADVRVQDPSFQCYDWDFTPPEERPGE